MYPLPPAETMNKNVKKMTPEQFDYPGSEGR